MKLKLRKGEEADTYRKRNNKTEIKHKHIKIISKFCNFPLQKSSKEAMYKVCLYYIKCFFSTSKLFIIYSTDKCF